MYIKFVPLAGMDIAVEKPNLKLSLSFCSKVWFKMQYKLPICQILLLLRAKKDDDSKP